MNTQSICLRLGAIAFSLLAPLAHPALSWAESNHSDASEAIVIQCDGDSFLEFTSEEEVVIDTEITIDIPEDIEETALDEFICHALVDLEPDEWESMNRREFTHTQSQQTKKCRDNFFKYESH